ncbi:MAG: GNAT family N-acetyltransferase [Bacillota bacterium]
MNITVTNSSNATQQFKGQLDDLIMEVFGFKFEEWHNKGFWNDDYERYSVIEDGVMLSNISAYRMKMLINGIEQDFLQLGSVATREGYRGKGLSKRIMEHIIEKYPDVPVFLGGDNDAAGFYLKCGFKPFTYWEPYINYSLKKGNGMVKLSIDDIKVDEYLKGRAQFSSILDCKNQYPINWFHILHFHKDNIYELSELDAMLIAKQYGKTLALFDVVAKKPLSFSDLEKHMSFDGVETIEFGFNPDWLGINYLVKERFDEEGTPFLKGDFKLKREFTIPVLLTT